MTSTERVLIFSPHPDDAELFMGGTLLKHLKEGAAVRVVMMSYGEKGSLLSLLGRRRQESLKRVRAAEVEARLRLAPALEMRALGMPDMAVKKTEDTVAMATAQLVDFRPTCIYLPESTKAASYYLHPDHLATGDVAESAARQFAGKVVLRHFHSKNPNVFVDISPHYEENLAALRCYRSQYRGTASPPFLLHLYERARAARTRKEGERLGVKFAEAFRQSGAEEGTGQMSPSVSAGADQ